MHKISRGIINAIKNGNKILVCGNGGSATMSSHFVGELVGKYNKERKALPAISLTSDSAVITSIANDLGYLYTFSRQVEALGKKGDVLVVFSTSGKSDNCNYAIATAKDLELKVYDLPRVGYSTSEIQENQLKLIHRISEEVEDYFA